MIFVLSYTNCSYEKPFKIIIIFRCQLHVNDELSCIGRMRTEIEFTRQLWGGSAVPNLICPSSCFGDETYEDRNNADSRLPYVTLHGMDA